MSSNPSASLSNSDRDPVEGVRKNINHFPSPLLVASTCFVFGLAAILLSGRMLVWLAIQNESEFVVATAQGTLFVCITALLVYMFVRQGISASARNEFGRQRMEDQLRLSERRFREFVDSIPQIAWAAAPDGQLLLLNQKALEYTGMDASELTGWKWAELIHPDDRLKSTNVWTETLQTEVPREHEMRIRHADGQYRWHVSRQVPVRDDSGAITAWYGTNTDIEQLKKTEQKLRESQEHLDLALATAQMGTWEWDMRTNETALSSTCWAILGDDFVGGDHDSFTSRIHTDDVERVMGTLMVTIQEKSAFSFEFRMITPSERPRWIFCSGKVVCDDSNQAVRMIGVLQDITNRMLTEETIRQSEQLLKLVLDTIPQGVFWKDRDSRILGCNRAIARFHNVNSVDELIGRTDAEFSGVTAEQAKFFIQKDREVMEFNTALLHIHEQLSLSEGQTVWLETSKVPLHDAAGNVVGILGTCEDITERKLAESQLRAERDRFELIMETAPVVICSFRMRPDGTVCFPYASPQIESIHGFTPAQLADNGSLIFQNTHPDDAGRLKDEIKKSARDMTPWRSEFRVIHPVRGEIWVEGHSVPVREADGGITWHGYVVDVTERIRSEQALRESEKRLNEAQHLACSGSWSWDPLAGTAHWSEAYYELYGFDRSIVPSAEATMSLVHPDDRAKSAEKVAAVLAGASGFINEARIIRPDGREIWMHSIARAIRDADGHLIRIEGTDQDITERKLADAEQQKLISLIERSRDFIALADLQGRITFMNSGARQMVGISDGDDVTGFSFADFIPPDTQDFLQQTVLGTALEKGEWEGEMQLVNRRTGELVDVLRTTFLIRDASGAPHCFASVTRDITERKRAEKVLRSSEKRYRQLVDLLPTSIFISHRKSNEYGQSALVIEFCNPAFLKLLGVNSFEDLQGQSPLEWIHPGDRDRVKARIAEVISTKKTASPDEIRFVRPDGRVVPVLSIATPIVDSSPEAYLVALSDLTERERSMELLRAVMRSVDDVIATVDEHGIVLSANEAANTVFGYPVAEMMGQTIENLLPEAPRDELARHLKNALPIGVATVDGIGREVEGVRKDGSRFPVDLKVSDFYLDGARRFTVVIRDITARKRLEAQFRQAQKLEAIGRLAGGVAHDFNNLLTVINSYSDILLTSLPPGDPHRHAAAAILDSGERAARLTQQLLAFSRKAIIQPKRLDLNELVSESANLLRRLVGEDIILTVIPDLSLVPIIADLGQIEQVIMNLAVNSRDAMPTGGNLTIETHHVVVNHENQDRFSDLPPGSYSQLVVSDNGVGMTEDVRGKIFEPFFTTKEPGKGTGLGLSVVHGIVEQCGGRIDVDSSPGVGTTFFILFPSDLVHQSDQPQETMPITVRGTETILIVEDQDAVRKVICLLLESHGFKVIEADRGPAAIELISCFPDQIDLLITDVVMPEMSGHDLVRVIRLRKPGLRVIYMSGYTDDALFRYGKIEATDGFLQKPFTPLTLVRKIRTILDAVEHIG